MQSKLASITEIMIGTSITIAVTEALAVGLEGKILIFLTSLLISTSLKYILRRLFNMRRAQHDT